MAIRKLLAEDAAVERGAGAKVSILLPVNAFVIRDIGTVRKLRSEDVIGGAGGV